MHSSIAGTVAILVGTITLVGLYKSGKSWQEAIEKMALDAATVITAPFVVARAAGERLLESF